MYLFVHAFVNYCSFIFWFRYVDGKAAFLYVENYFLRKPNLDFNLIAKDCFLCEEIGTLIDRSRPPKRAFKVSDLKSNRPGYAT